MKKIVSLYSEVTGWIYSEDGEIEEYQVNGEMAPVSWYRQIKKDKFSLEINGKFVQVINRSL